MVGLRVGDLEGLRVGCWFLLVGFAVGLRVGCWFLLVGLVDGILVVGLIVGLRVVGAVDTGCKQVVKNGRRRIGDEDESSSWLG